MDYIPENIPLEEPNKTHGKMQVSSPPKMWVISYSPLNMRENVGSQGFWWYLVSKSSWSPPTFQRFSPEFWQQSTKSRKFQFQIAPFRKNQAAVGSVRDLLKETPWKSFPLEFSAPTQRIFRYMFPAQIMKKNRSNASAFREFLFLQHFDLSKLPIDSYRASPCDSGFSTILLLHYGWIEVEGVLVCENCLDDQKSIL